MTVENPTDVLHTINIVTQALCIPIVTVFVALRFYTRFRFKQSLGVEDSEFVPCRYTFFGDFANHSLVACTIAWFLFMGYCAISIVSRCYTFHMVTTTYLLY